MVAQHVEEGHLDQYRPEKLRPLSQYCTDQETTVGTPGGRQPLRTGVALLNEPLCSSDEVIKAVLLVAEHATLVPALAVLTTPANVRDRQNSAMLQPEQQRPRKRGSHTDVEAAV